MIYLGYEANISTEKKSSKNLSEEKIMRGRNQHKSIPGANIKIMETMLQVRRNCSGALQGDAKIL